MDYWKDMMNWPLEEHWVCEVCGENCGLIWGMIHGECRCDLCHTVYSMRNKGVVLTVPRCMLKEEYKEPAKIGCKVFGIPLDEWSEEMWDKATELSKASV